MSDKTYDVLIIGGGYAGLSTALAMCRTGASTAVFDDQTYRNKDAEHMHTLATWDHRAPSEWRDATRKEIAEGRYDTTTFVEQSVRVEQLWRISDTPTMFGLKDSDGKIWKGRKVVLATGAKPTIPDVPGFLDCYPKSIWYCLFCKGIEARDLGNPQSTAGVLMTDNLMLGPGMGHHFAIFSKRHVNKVTLYTHGNKDLAEKVTEKFAYLQNLPEAERWVTVEPRRIVKLEPTDGVAVNVHLEGGDVQTQAFLTHFTKNDAGTSFTINEAPAAELEPLAIKTDDGPKSTIYYRITKASQPEGKALKLSMNANYASYQVHGNFFESGSEPGVFFPGDSGNGFKSIALALSGASQAASGVIMALMDEDEDVEKARAAAAKAKAEGSSA